jgi:hypothetical protein
MAPQEYSFEKGLNSEKDYDDALALLSQLRNTNLKDDDNSYSDSMLKLAIMVEKYERQRYLIFYNGYTC